MSRPGPLDRDDVANSRLFILGGKGASEEEFRECFGKFGQIKDVWIVKDRRTNEDKGGFCVCFDHRALQHMPPTPASVVSIQKKQLITYAAQLSFSPLSCLLTSSKLVFVPVVEIDCMIVKFEDTYYLCFLSQPVTDPVHMT